MKAKLSVTLEHTLVAFIDAEPGENRSQKVASMVTRYKRAKEDRRLRESLAIEQPDDDAETEAWRRAMEDSQWRESAVATSGRSRSPRSRSRGRRSS